MLGRLVGRLASGRLAPTGRPSLHGERGKPALNAPDTSATDPLTAQPRSEKMRPLAQAPDQASRRLIDPRVPVDTLHYLPTQDIVFAALEEFNQANTGEVRRGNWDLLCKRFDRLDIYVAFDAVMHRDLRWQDTVFFQNSLARILAGEPLWDCRSRADLEQRCRDLGDLYRRIARDGYLNQHQVRVRYGRAASENARHEIIVGIGRCGDILFGNAAHRLSIPKHLSLPEVPVRIAARHEEWVAFQNELAAGAAASERGALCQPVEHPDLRHLPAEDASVDLFKRISETRTSRSGKLLDLGARLGYFCRRFNRQGFECFAFEPDPGLASLLRRIQDQLTDGPHLITEPTRAALDRHNFAVTLLLGGLDRVTAQDGSAEAACRHLASIRTEELFLECRGQSQERMAQQVAAQARFDRLDNLGTTSGAGRLYHLHGARTA